MNTFRNTHIGRLFQNAYKDFNLKALAKLQDVGYTELTYSQIELISHIDTEGTHITELAKKLRTTKQATGEAVGVLVNLGYLKRTKDQQDLRAVLITFTKKGCELINTAAAVKEEIEAEYKNIIGANKFTELKKILNSFL